MPEPEELTGKDPGLGWQDKVYSVDRYLGSTGCGRTTEGRNGSPYYSFAYIGSVSLQNNRSLNCFLDSYLESIETGGCRRWK